MRLRASNLRRKLRTGAVLVVGTAAGLFFLYATGLFRSVETPRDVPPKAPETVRFVTLNAAHGRGLALYQGLVEPDVIRSNLKEIGDYLRRLDADVVGLQETDKDCSWSGNFDHLQVIAEHAGMPYYRFGLNNRNGGRYRLKYGNAILSRHPIVDFENHPFGDAPVGEKGFLVARVLVGQRAINCVVTHLAPVGASNRERQVGSIVQTIGSSREPLVVMGDLNSELSEQSAAKHLRTALGLRSYASSSEHADTLWQVADRRIDFIFISGGLSYANYMVSGAKLSDHHPVVADLVLQ